MWHRDSIRAPARHLLALLLGVCASLLPVAACRAAPAEVAIPLGPGVTAFWGDPAAGTASAPWQAQWIWAQGGEEADAMLARTAFELDGACSSARLRLTASTVYTLHVNGVHVARGPARSAAHHQSYDEFDVSGLLRPGRNALAVRVHYQAGTVSYYAKGRAGLLLQMEVTVGNQTLTVASGQRWKAIADPTWDPQSPRMSRFTLEVCDRVDLRRRPRDWSAPEFDDAAWPAATPLRREVGWPSVQENSQPGALTFPWTALRRRDIPYLRESVVSAEQLLEATLIRGPRFRLEPADAAGIRAVQSVDLSGRNVQQGEEITRAPDGAWELPEAKEAEGWFLLFDLGTVMNGLPRLEASGPAGTVVDFISAPFVVGKVFTGNIVDSQWIDRVVLSGGHDRWEATYSKPGRYLAAVVRNRAGPVRLRAIGLRRLEYPFAERGQLRTPENRWWEECWQAAAKTIAVCTTDAFMDNYRERRQYVQTAYYAALGNFWTFGDTALLRRCLVQAAEEQQADGLMPAYAPRVGDDYMVILDANTAWIRGLRLYFLYSGDSDTVRGLLPAARRVMEMFRGWTNPLGLLDDPPHAYWLDHALNDRRGANFCLNGHYLGALEDYADLLAWAGEPGAAGYRHQAAQLRKSLREQFWNPTRQLFCDALVDGSQSDLFSEHANAMALAMRVATSEQGRAVARQLLDQGADNFIKGKTGITVATPAMSYFLHLGLGRYGYTRESLRMLHDRFGHMLQPPGNGTLWEEWWLDGTGRTGKLVKGRTRSDAQTESAFPPALFGEFCLGLSPLKPGLQEVGLSRPDCGLQRIEGALPAPMGTLHVKWDLAGGDLQVVIPAGMRVRLNVTSLRTAGGPVVRVDGRPLTEADPTDGFLVLAPGTHQVRFQ